MSGRPIKITAQTARRIAVAKQHLSGAFPRRAAKHDLVSLVHDLPFVQWDPVTVVAPSHILSIWSRLGSFRTSDLDDLLWKERRLFLHWTPIAFVVPTADYRLYDSLMRRYPESLTGSWGSQRARAKQFLSKNQGLRRRMLRELENGPRQLSQFTDYVRTKKSEDGWGSASAVSDMMFHMHMMGEVMVVDHMGNQNVWGLTADFLPGRSEEAGLSEDEFECEAAQRSIKGLGTASPREITYYFVPGRYHNLKKALSELEEDSKVHRVEVEGFGREERYIHDSDVELVQSVGGDGWSPRTTLIPPFDNILRGTARAERVFGFRYVREQFLPKEKRRYGTYVLPILRGDRLIGRIDPKLDKVKGRLVVNSVHSEPGAPSDKVTAAEIRNAIEGLAEFIGAREVEFSANVPDAWRGSLR